jgi:murein DD-endopeptidase MepM/ murein hydrolase activator NlpD
MVPLSGLQLLCCAAVVGIAVHFTSGLFRHVDSTTEAALTAFEVAAMASSAQTAAEAALANLSEIKVVVQRNDTLDAIFRRLQFSLTDLSQILALDKARSALTLLKPGDELTLLTTADDGRLMGLERLIGDDKRLKVERNQDEDVFVASVEELPVSRHVTTATGTIQAETSSLYAAAAVAGLQHVTTDRLADIFRWDIDFVFDVREGDTFHVIYEQRERDGERLRDGNILAAEYIMQNGKSFRAVRYEFADGKADYYTPEGTSLRKAFLKTPVQFSRISSVFNPKRRHPVLNTIRAHRGVDYAAPAGTKVYAAGAGRVQFRGQKGGFGNLVEIAHSGKVVTRYGHLQRFAPDLKVGQRVEQGQLIGYVGSTGLATGPHLHFEFIENGVYVDPQKAIRRGEPGPPIPADQRQAFEAQIAPLLAQLDAVQLSRAGTALASR